MVLGGFIWLCMVFNCLSKILNVLQVFASTRPVSNLLVLISGAQA